MCTHTQAVTVTRNCVIRLIFRCCIIRRKPFLRGAKASLALEFGSERRITVRVRHAVTISALYAPRMTPLREWPPLFSAALQQRSECVRPRTQDTYPEGQECHSA